MGGHSDVGFPFGEASLGISYAGFSKLKQELPPPLGPPSSASVAAAMASSRPPWALPPMMGASAATATEHHGLPLLGHGGRSFSELHSTPQVSSSSSSFGVPYDGGSMYKPPPLAAASSGYGSLKERGGGGGSGGARHQHYPLQYNGGSLVLDHHRGELINLSKMTPQEILDAKALAASKSHSEAERRRRERINNHLNTLRSLLPSTTKTDKASLLAEVIQHVKELKRQAAEIAEGGPVPSDVDEIKVDAETSSSDGNVVMKASLCCDDRPDLLSDLTKVLKTLKLKTLKAEIATLGGRVKNVIVIGKDATAVGEGADEMAAGSAGNSSSSSGSGQQDRPSVNCVQEALRAVIERSSNDASASGYSSGGKRQKMNHHHESSSSGY